MSAKPTATAAVGSDSGSTLASKPTTDYRNTTVEDDDDDDLDDLDDVLESFDAQKSSLGKRSQPEPSTSTPIHPTAAAAVASESDPAEGQVDDDEFQASLIEGMESLLRSLASEHPPGPMPDTAGTPGKSGQTPELSREGLSSEEEERAFQRAVEMMLSGEGMEAMGLDGKKKAASTGPSKESAPRAPPANFDDTMRKAMESINAGGAGAASSAEGMPDDLAALLKQLSEDPSALDGLGDDDDELGGLLDGMMAQLMSREVLEEPMTELAAKYPEYLEKPPAGVKADDLEKYRQQHKLVQQILAVFKRPNYSDDVDGKEVARLVGEMQDLGGPPNEIMGDLPEGFDLNALGGGSDGCVVM